jgi:tetratricopeptide (TPR) repeat protein
MEQFIAEHPKSARVPEALYWVGWTYRAEGHPEKTADVYWSAIHRFADDPTSRSVDDLFPALARLYKTDDERAAYRAMLRDLREDADKEHHRALAMRSLWAEGQFIAKSDPDASRKLLLEAAKLAQVQTDNPLLLADFADTYRGTAQTAQADQLYRNLLKWNPRAPQKDRVFAGLGLIAQAARREKAALDYFDRFQRETLGSPLFSQVMLAKADLLVERGQSKEAKAALEALLAQRGAPGSDKARALYQIGELHMKAKQPQLAVPYFQRIYIMHGRWAEYVAKAYLRSGEAFEELKDRTAAVKTYHEMLEREELQSMPELASARARLVSLEGSK